MRSIEETSGPWVGWSVQYNKRIHERMSLRVGGGAITGSGEDADGDFDLDGNYEASGEVAIVRRYSYCTSGPEGVGIPYLYRGHWDGSHISGTWGTIFGPQDGGPFEMWPEDGSLELNFEEALQAEPALT
ncbi:hypothetical protein EON82_17595 [bacterium]|nr:MAG: hypothetical protein EON82_17595 [bacterium]